LDSCIVDQPQTIDEEQSSSLLESIKRTHSLSKQTYDLCTSSLAAGKDLVDHGETIQRSLIGAATDLNAESFSVIADLIDGDTVKEARSLAESMKDKSSECISLSVEMVTALEQSINALPDVIEKYVEGKASEAVEGEVTSEERDLADVDSDVKDLTDCIDAIENLRLVTAIEAGNNAFRSITDKGQQCHKIYTIIQKFALALTTITEAFLNMDVSAVISKMKDILRAIGLTSMIKKFAEGCTKMMDKVVELFRAAAGKLSLLWKSLVAAKDKMIESLTDVVGTGRCLTEANEKMDSLQDLVKSLGSKFWDVRELSPDSYKLLKSLDSDSCLDDAMQTTRGIDDSVEAAIQQMKNAAQRVQDEYDALPDMITDGILASADEDDEDMKITARGNEGLQADIHELEAAAKTVEEANILESTKAMHKEMKSMDDKLDKCKDMLSVCSDFAGKSKAAIDSFMGNWTFETAVSQIQKMSKLVSLSEFMEQIASQVQSLLRAMGKLLKAVAMRLKAVIEKVKSMMDIGNAVESAADFVHDGISSAVDCAGEFMGSMFKRDKDND
jgi:hypothetical protein